MTLVEAKQQLADLSALLDTTAVRIWYPVEQGHDESMQLEMGPEQEKIGSSRCSGHLPAATNIENRRNAQLHSQLYLVAVEKMHCSTGQFATEAILKQHWKSIRKWTTRFPD